MDAVVKEEDDSVNDERNMIEPKKEIEGTLELKEPKVELIDEMDVKMEEIDEDEYRHIIPYEYRDYLEQNTEEDRPTSSEEKPGEQESPSKKRTAECQVCRKNIVRSLIKHAATHTNIRRSSCPVDECDYKSDEHQNVIKHMKHKHKIVEPNVRNIVRKELSGDEKAQLKKVIEDCFPGVIRQKTCNAKALYSFNCQICNISISEPGLGRTWKRRNHAFTHTDIILYECIEPECDFKTNYIAAYQTHQNSRHGISSGMISKETYKVPPEKSLAIEKVLLQCFPELKHKLAPKTNFCKICHRAMHTRSSTAEFLRRSHALKHTDIMTYKCCKEDCDYKAQDRYAMINHQKLMHRMNMNVTPVIKIELTIEQEIEIERMMVQCFSEWSDT